MTQRQLHLQKPTLAWVTAPETWNLECTSQPADYLIDWRVSLPASQLVQAFSRQLSWSESLSVGFTVQPLLGRKGASVSYGQGQGQFQEFPEVFVVYFLVLRNFPEYGMFHLPLEYSECSKLPSKIECFIWRELLHTMCVVQIFRTTFRNQNLNKKREDPRL